MTCFFFSFLFSLCFLTLLLVSQAFSVHPSSRSSKYENSLWPVELDEIRTRISDIGFPEINPVAHKHDHGSISAGFNPLEASASSIVEAVFRRTLTCRDIISAFLARIEVYNPTINALTLLNPTALSDASTIDALLTTNSPLSTHFTSPPSLLCVPILVKDNILTHDLPTTAGSLALNSTFATSDAPILHRLLAHGAIFLGKTNLHELALEGLTVSSAGGQTLNPYDLTRTPGGSSGGSGAALAAGFGVLALGTDTVNSLRSPASANAVLSLRGTTGLLSTEGVVPVSRTQDVVGVMAGTAMDLRMGWEAVVGDQRDGLDGGLPGDDCGSGAKMDPYLPPLTGLTFGLVEGLIDRSGANETGPVAAVVDEFVASLREAGARVVEVRDPMFKPAAISALDVQAYEFREELNAFLADPELYGTGPRTFEELFERNDFMVIPERYEFVQKAHKVSTSDQSYMEAMRKVHELRAALSEAWDKHGEREIDFLIYPEQRNLVVKVGSPNQYGRNGHLGALTGRPVLAFPAGFSAASKSALRGVPIGIEVMGRKYDDLKLLRLAERLEAVCGDRSWPELVRGSVEARQYSGMSVVVPNRTIPDAYPMGVYKAV